MRWSPIVLVVLMVLAVWYRAHTFAPDVRAVTGVDLWPRTVGASEPLDCDEAAYAYMGHRVLKGDALYRDLTEYKPPLGYWIYTAAVAAGGYRELAIRLMAIPFVLGTIAAVWWVAGRLGGPIAACLAAFLYILLSTDPFVFGNGSNMEHFINWFSILTLEMTIRGLDRDDRRWLFGAGVALGASAMVKQVALAQIVVILPALLLGRRASGDGAPRGTRRSIGDVLILGSGTALIAGVALAVVIARGAGPAAYQDIVLQARALATDTLPDPNQPSPAVRWLTGNADPKGNLPPPFGTTDYYVWWATGSWPLWLASAPALIYLTIGPRSDSRRRLAAGWTIAAWLQVILPGLYWPHYYLLPTPGVAIAVAVALADAIGSVRRVPSRRWLAGVAAFLLAVAVAGTTALQIRYYLAVPPAELTRRYKGGGQWIVLRQLGRELGRRCAGWDHPRLYVWGWQSPLHFYSGLDSPTRHFFVDNLLRDLADRDHPLIGPRVAEILDTLRRRPPELIFAGYPPFSGLRAFLPAHYRRTRFPGLWVRADVADRFEAPASTSATTAR